MLLDTANLFPKNHKKLTTDLQSRTEPSLKGVEVLRTRAQQSLGSINKGKRLTVQRLTVQRLTVQRHHDFAKAKHQQQLEAAKVGLRELGQYIHQVDED